MEISLDSFVLRNGFLPTFICPVDFENVFEKVKFVHFWSKSGHLPGFCPLLKTTFGHEKPLFYGGLRAFWSKTHFYFHLL